MSAPAVKRGVLSFSRALEFASEPELAKRMGCGRALWPRAVVKELIDNGLDAGEEHDVAPTITISIEGNKLSVADNAGGMSPELIERLCVRSERTSTKEGYAALDRGSMGNALQVLMALPFGFGRDEAVTTITSQGFEHTITLRVNRLEGRIDLERTERTVPEMPGTIVSLSWPEEIDCEDVETLIDQHAWLNPHAEFELDGQQRRRFWQRRAEVTKWTPGLATPAHWYTPDRFAHRVLLEIRRDPKITVAQFLGTFKGLTSSTKRSEVADAAGLSYAPLAALLDASKTALNIARTRRLLVAMQEASRPPRHAVLGTIGKETCASWLRNLGSGDPGFLAYTIVDGVVKGDIPYRWEVGFAHLPRATERALLIGQNFSPAISGAEMFNAILPWCPDHLDPHDPVALFLHRITPARQTLDYGKSKLAIGYGETSGVCDPLEKIGAPWIKLRNAELRGKKPPAEPKPEGVTFQDAAFSAMADAYDEASSYGKYPVLSQQIFYKARPAILEATGKDELKKGERARFCYVLLPLFMQENRDLTARWRVLYKPRGELIEPHTGRRVGLGTREVAAYRAGWINGTGALGGLGFVMADWKPETSGPCHRYGGVLVVEKGGIADVLRTLKIGERFDVAIVGNEGQSVEAELKLVDAFGGLDTDLPIFLLTDFDRQGLTIAENLRAGTWRHRYVNAVKVIHVGLRLDQIDALGGLASAQEDGGLEDEPIGEKTLKHVGDDRLRACGATEDEIQVLRTRRVELNALSTAQLVDRVETAFAEHGIGKVMPTAEDLTAAWRSAKAHAEIAATIERANTRAEKRWQKAPAPADLEDQIRRRLEEHPTAPWDAALRRIAEDKP